MKYKYGIIRIKSYQDGEIEDYELIDTLDYNPLEVSCFSQPYKDYDLQLDSSYYVDYNNSLPYSYNGTSSVFSDSAQQACELDLLSEEFEKIYNKSKH